MLTYNPLQQAGPAGHDTVSGGTWILGLAPEEKEKWLLLESFFREG